MRLQLFYKLLTEATPVVLDQTGCNVLVNLASIGARPKEAEKIAVVRRPASTGTSLVGSDASLTTFVFTKVSSPLGLLQWKAV